MLDLRTSRIYPYKHLCATLIVALSDGIIFISSENIENGDGRDQLPKIWSCPVINSTAAFTQLPNSTQTLPLQELPGSQEGTAQHEGRLLGIQAGRSTAAVQPDQAGIFPKVIQPMVAAAPAAPAHTVDRTDTVADDIRVQFAAVPDERRKIVEALTDVEAARQISESQPKKLSIFKRKSSMAANHGTATRKSLVSAVEELGASKALNPADVGGTTQPRMDGWVAWMDGALVDDAAARLAESQKREAAANEQLQKAHAQVRRNIGGRILDFHDISLQHPC